MSTTSTIIRTSPPAMSWSYKDLESEVKQLASKSVNQVDKKTILSTSQIRKFLAAINVLRYKVKMKLAGWDRADIEEIRNHLFLTKARLIYQLAKAKETNRREKANLDFIENKLIARLDNIINNLSELSGVNRLIDYVEMFTAYHKSQGGD